MSVNVFVGKDASAKLQSYLGHNPEAVVVSIKDAMVQMATLLRLEGTQQLSEELLLATGTHPILNTIARQPNVIVHEVTDALTLRLLKTVPNCVVHGVAPDNLDTKVVPGTRNFPKSCAFRFVQMATPFYNMDKWDDLTFLALKYMRGSTLVYSTLRISTEENAALNEKCALLTEEVKKLKQQIYKSEHPTPTISPNLEDLVQNAKPSV